MKPTALLIKTHLITGLKYFCKTTILNKINTYCGSGLHWKRHLKIHGKKFSTELIGIYYEKELLVAAALKFSTDNNIVESDEWANMKPENGLDGALPGHKRPDVAERNKNWQRSEETRKKMKASGKIKVFSQSHRDNLSKSGKVRVFSQSHRDALAAATKRNWDKKKEVIV
jgi:hypothetical protein